MIYTYTQFEMIEVARLYTVINCTHHTHTSHIATHRSSQHITDHTSRIAVRTYLATSSVFHLFHSCHHTSALTLVSGCGEFHPPIDTMCRTSSPRPRISATLEATQSRYSLPAPPPYNTVQCRAASLV